jgi:hypothetical protein
MHPVLFTPYGMYLRPNDSAWPWTPHPFHLVSSRVYACLPAKPCITPTFVYPKCTSELPLRPAWLTASLVLPHMLTGPA